MEIEKLFVSLALNAAKYAEGLQDAQREGASWSERMRASIGGGLQTAVKVGATALLGLGVTIGGVAAAGINQFIGFQNQMNEVFTLLPGITEDAMDDMRGDVLQFSKDFAVLPNEVVPALYQSLSAGVPPDNVFSFLEVAQKAAVGGVTELETAVDGISSVVNAYGDDVIDAATASDVMFTAVRLGKTDFEQLSRSLFNVIPTASSLGIEFGEVAAGLATLTAQGTPTSVATTQLRQLFVEASKSGTTLDKTIRQLTGQGLTGLIAEGRTVTDVLQEVRDSVGEQEFRNMFGSVEALNAALGTTGPNVEAMTANMDAMNDSVGATDAAYETMDKGIQRTIDRFKAFASTALIQVGDALSPLIDKALALGEQALPFVESALSTLTGVMESFFANLEEGMSPLDAFIEAIWDIAPPELLDGLTNFRDNILPGIMTALENLWTAVQPVIETVANAVTQFVSWQDVMTAVGVIIGGVLLNVVAGIVAALAPVIAAVAAVIAVVALLRNAWENDWGGIQEKVAVAWAFIQGVFQQLSAWVTAVLIPTVQDLWQKWTTIWWPAISQALSEAWNNVILPALTALWTFVTETLIPTIRELWTQWTTVWWPAISQALSDAWNNIILPALTALWGFITNTVIPTVRNLWDKWSNVWWPAISTALENAWTVIKAIWEELGRWINDNIVPWVEFLHEKWVEEVWPAMQGVIEDVWAVIGPIWETFREYLVETLPPALEGLQGVLETVMTAIQTAIQPVKDLWDRLVDAVVNFWDWISSHTFHFNISIPDLPDWAVPGSPLPIHTAWKNFAEDMNRTSIEPRFDLSGAAALVGAAGSGGTSTSYSSQTTVQLAPGADPLRALRASRHLDKLGRA